jgi:hypothetical protein
MIPQQPLNRGSRLSLRRLLSRAGFLLGALIFLQQLCTGYQAIGEGIAFGSLLPVAAASYGIALITGALQLLAWHRLMAGIGAPLSWRHAIAGYTVAFLPRYIPGSIWGYLSRAQWFRDKAGIAYGVSSAGSLLEVMAILTANGLIAGVYFAATSAGALRIILVVIVLGTVPLLWLTVHKVAAWTELPAIAANRLRGLMPHGLGLADWTMLVLTYVLFWIAYGGVILLLGEALGAAKPVELMSATFSFSSSWLAGFAVIFTPAGLGVRELALSTQAVSLMGLTAIPASALAVLMRFLMLLSELTWVVIGVALGYSSERQRPERQAKHD